MGDGKKFKRNILMKKAQMSVKLQRQPESVPQPYIQLFKKIPIFDLIFALRTCK